MIKVLATAATAATDRPAVLRLVLLAWLAVVGLTVYVSLAPGMGATSAYHIDKLLHLGAYLALGALPALVLPRPAWSLLAAVFLVAVGIGLELGQGFVVGRVASLQDAAANALGAALGVAIALQLRQRLQPR